MASRSLKASIAWLSIWILQVYTQTIAPSNSTHDIDNPSTSGRFLLNGTEFKDLAPIGLAPLGQFANLDYQTFVRTRLSGHLVNVGQSNANEGTPSDQFSYISCDPQDYTGNLDASRIFQMAISNAESTNIIILYSSTSNHCNTTALGNVDNVNFIMTTTSSTMAAKLASLNLNLGSPGTCLIFPDYNSYSSNATNGNAYSSGGPLGAPTTAVAMIILYSITGLITALFVVIIITGAIRAHRHPERYGPRNVIGRGRQSRARGIARAMLETLPIVKFGDQNNNNDSETQAPNPQSKPSTRREADIEMSPTNHESNNQDSTPSTASDTASQTAAAAKNADGTDAEGHLGCSICTEDFTKGEEVRVLPCNHKFHPDCVDPWLLNVSGTCPLCRIDLRPADETAAEDQEHPPSLSRRGSTANDLDVIVAPPLLSEDPAATGAASNPSRRDYIANLRSIASGSREERIAALRRVRAERRSVAGPTTEDERKGLARRFRERFRIRTERRGTVYGLGNAAGGDGVAQE